MIDEEIRGMIKSVFDHPDEIKYLTFYMQLRNGTVIRYNYDRRVADKLKAREEYEAQQAAKRKQAT